MDFQQSLWQRDSCLRRSKQGAAYSLIGAILLAVQSLHAANGKLEVTYIDVGQADAILVTCPDGNHHLLIDSGDTRYPDSSKHFRSFRNAAFTNKPHHLDVVRASHEHTDHIGSMRWVLTNFQVGTYVDNGNTADTSAFANLQTEFVSRAVGNLSNKLSLAVTKTDSGGK